MGRRIYHRGGQRTEQVVSGFECVLAILTVWLASLCSIQHGFTSEKQEKRRASYDDDEHSPTSKTEMGSVEATSSSPLATAVDVR